MKLLISPSTSVIPADKMTTEKWNVDHILTYGSDIKADFSQLPFKESDPDVTIIVPTIIESRNALAYDGVALALKILFKTICARQRGINIILMGCETPSSFMRHYAYPNIMKIPGISYSLFNCKTVAALRPESCPIMLRDDYKPYLKNLGISMPTSFRSTHSMTNEWSLYKWNSFMDFDESADHGITDCLYFDYIKAIEKIDNIKSRKISNNEPLCKKLEALRHKQSRVLLIDDNIKWHRFFEKFFSNSNICFESIGENFKKMAADEVLRQALEKVESFNPNIILLDFRLIEDKDADEKFSNISGVTVLQGLKGNFVNTGIAFGRQILMFTATSRIENFLRFKSLNADGFILKEKPENYTGKEITKDAISKMISSFETAIDRANFLIPLNANIDALSAISNKYPEMGEKTKIAIAMMSQSVRQLTQNNGLNKDVLKLAFLNIFSVLESLKDDNGSLYKFISEEASRIKLSPEYFVLLEPICEIRKCLAHGDPVIDKGELRERIISVDILLKWTINLSVFIVEFLKLYYLR